MERLSGDLHTREQRSCIKRELHFFWSWTFDANLTTQRMMKRQIATKADAGVSAALIERLSQLWCVAVSIAILPPLQIQSIKKPLCRVA